MEGTGSGCTSSIGRRRAAGHHHYDRDRSAFAELDPAGIDWASCSIAQLSRRQRRVRSRRAEAAALFGAVRGGAAVHRGARREPSPLVVAGDGVLRCSANCSPTSTCSAPAPTIWPASVPDDADLGTQAAALGVTTLMLRRKCFVGSLVELTIIVADRTGSVSVGRVAGRRPGRCRRCGIRCGGGGTAVGPLADVANAAADAAACYSTRGVSSAGRCGPATTVIRSTPMTDVFDALAASGSRSFVVPTSRPRRWCSPSACGRVASQRSSARSSKRERSPPSRPLSSNDDRARSSVPGR